MKRDIIVKEDLIDVVAQVSATIFEFDAVYDKEYFEARYNNATKLILVAYINEVPIGFIVAYDKENNGSFYCWMAGVNPNFRRLGVLDDLMKYLEKWAGAKGYKKITIKTRNQRREMLAYLVKNNYNFIDVQSQSLVKDNRILLEKNIENN
ncbi:MAG: GNAT family N-acetyltransferase [Candidatus Moraniibacteriota bacterium]